MKVIFFERKPSIYWLFEVIKMHIAQDQFVNSLIIVSMSALMALK